MFEQKCVWQCCIDYKCVWQCCSRKKFHVEVTEIRRIAFFISFSGWTSRITLRTQRPEWRTATAPPSSASVTGAEDHTIGEKTFGGRAAPPPWTRACHLLRSRGRRTAPPPRTRSGRTSGWTSRLRGGQSLSPWLPILRTTERTNKRTKCRRSGPRSCRPPTDWN